MVPAVSVLDALLGGLRATVFQVVFILGPLFLFAVVLHFLERFTSRRLSERLGWWSILWTGWIGTPIHELSHAIFCPPFGHKIKEIALFKPDRKTGCLGYVNHSYNRRNPWAVIGNFFIGAAPLLGGAAALFLVLYVFYPDTARLLLRDATVAEGVASGNLLKMISSYLVFAVSVFKGLASAVSLASWQLYLFLYLIVCIGSHLAPSAQDMEGMGKGFLVFLLLILVVNIVVSFIGPVSDQAALAVARIMGPVVALFAVAAVLNAIVAVLVFVVTSILDVVRPRPAPQKSQG